jgi:ParB-like chromosome segregation protein Spo0J
VIHNVVESCSDYPERERIGIYNTAVRTLAEMVADISKDPALRPQLIPAEAVVGNDYNPNRVASVELDLLEESIRADGITMAIVVMPDRARGRWVVVDGFHRREVAAGRLGCAYLPCTEITRDLADRMASTVRHNRARGKHQVELMAALVRDMVELGWDDERMGTALGMSPEELLRLKQIVGAARLLAAETYSESYGRSDEPDPPHHQS